jgi:hypothetical protein
MISSKFLPPQYLHALGVIVKMGDHFRIHLFADSANYPSDFFLLLMDVLRIIYTIKFDIFAYKHTLSGGNELHHRRLSC